MITKSDFLAYEGVRQLGITNMFNVKMVCQLSGLTKEEVIDIMKNYSKYRNEYIK